MAITLASPCPPVQTGIIRSLKAAFRKPPHSPVWSPHPLRSCRSYPHCLSPARVSTCLRWPVRPTPWPWRRPPAVGRMLTVITANPLDAQRLQEEIAWFAPRLARASAARLGDPALRHALATPRPGFRTPGDALRDQPRRLRHRADSGHHGAASPAARRISGGAYLLSQAGRTPRRGGPARPADPGRLPARHPGRLAGRIQRARRPHRPLPDGFGAALPHRSVRRRDRDPAQLRRRFAAHGLPGAGDPPAAGAGIPARRSRPHALPRPLSRDLRGRSVALADLQGRLQRHRAGRHRVLPAAVLR